LIQLLKLYPEYVIAKKKLILDQTADFSQIVLKLKDIFKDHNIDERDGLWIEDKNGWVQIRKSNTEPIMRIYAEGRNENEAENLANRIISIVKNL